MIIVHGAGSFGHHQAQLHGVSRGPLTDPRVRAGFAATRRSVTLLNQLVVSSLIEAGLDACGMSPFPSWITTHRQVAQGDLQPLSTCLCAGLVPVMHGDAVLDSALGCTVLSGDTIVKHLAEGLRPSYVVFLTDVAGVYDRDPKAGGATRIPEILVAPDGSWEAAGCLAPSLVAASAFDTTGGMEAKVREAVCIAVLGIPVVITEAGTPSAAAALKYGPAAVAALGQLWAGTVVTLKR
ncbi:MAG: hypothetical protein WDW36_003983 [Sanguina aurantia]